MSRYNPPDNYNYFVKEDLKTLRAVFNSRNVCTIQHPDTKTRIGRPAIIFPSNQHARIFAAKAGAVIADNWNAQKHYPENEKQGDDFLIPYNEFVINHGADNTNQQYAMDVFKISPLTFRDMFADVTARKKEDILEVDNRSTAIFANSCEEAATIAAKMNYELRNLLIRHGIRRPGAPKEDRYKIFIAVGNEIKVTGDLPEAKVQEAIGLLTDCPGVADAYKNSRKTVLRR